MSINRFIFVNTEFVGYHSYPDAPEEVKYLRNIHRHLFKVQVSIEVRHNERDIEFHMFKRFIDSLVANEVDWNNLSCESISDKLYSMISTVYPRRQINIVVSEDGECGSIISYTLFKEAD